MGCPGPVSSVTSSLKFQSSLAVLLNEEFSRSDLHQFYYYVYKSGIKFISISPMPKKCFILVSIFSFNM